MTETADLLPFDDRLLQHQEGIRALQQEATGLLTLQDELLGVYQSLLTAANVTLRDRVSQIDGSLGVLRRTFTTVYIITFSAQELLDATVSEFRMAVELVRRIEATDLVAIAGSAEVVRESAEYVSAAAGEAEELRGNFSREVDELRNATYEILAVSAAILELADDLVLIQDQVWAELEDVVSTYGDLDADLDDADSALSSLETDLLTLTSRLSLKLASLVDVPRPDVVVYLTGNVTETESFLRDDVLSEIANQIDQFEALNRTHTDQRLTFERLFRETSSLGLDVASLLELIETAYEEVSTVSEDIQSLIDEGEMVAENLESFNNVTFAIAEEVAGALEGVESEGEDASEALQVARDIVEALEGSSINISTAKGVALDALNVTTESFQV